MVSGLAWRRATAGKYSHGAAPAAARCSLPEQEQDAVTATGPTSLGPDRRLPDKAAFDRVFSAPDARHRRHPFSLLARKRDHGPARLGLVIGKRNAKRAVDRNLMRRILREHFRQTPLTAIDIVVLARPGAAKVDRAGLNDAARWLFERLAAEVAGTPSC